MKILKITGETTGDEESALHEVLGIWERGGTASERLMHRLPTGRVEILVSVDAAHDQLAIIVIDNGVVGFHPLDESEPHTIH